MSVINTNVTSLIAQRSLAKNQSSLQTSLQRLSTGLKINSGADDPAGLIASQNLQAEQTGITQAIDNANRANNVIGTAEGGLNEVSNLLTQLTGLVNQSANSGGLSSSEVQANQLQVDSILSTINRISDSTSFNGTKLLNGGLSYTASSAATSAFANLSINAANLPGNKTEAVVVQVTNSATQGQVKYTGTTSALGGAPITLQIAGNAGTQQLSFAGSSTLSSVAAAINNISSTTGVTVSSSGKYLNFKANNYGSSQYVSVQAISGTFNTTGGTAGKASGTDAAVKVNGAAAQADGIHVSYRASSLDVSFDLTTGTGGGLNGGKTKTFGITGGGATFSLGAKVTETDKASIGIQSVSTGSLGDSTLGFLNSLGSGGANSLTSASLVNAQSIVNAAITQVSTLRGRLGAFQKFTLGSTINALGVAYENASAAESAITDTNFAQETANLTRSQILQQASTTVLSQANAAPQSVLKLLG